MGHSNPPRERTFDPASRSSLAAMGRLVVVTMETSDEANLGAICRAMKNFGARRLCPVAPRCPDPKGVRAQTLACNATDLLDAARVVPTLDEAARVEGIEFFAACTARRSSRRGPFLAPSEFARQVVPLLAEGRTVGLLMGREDRGLHNAEVDRARWKVSIPTSPELPSLNLAQATVVILSAMWEAAARDRPPAQAEEKPAGEGIFGPEMAAYNQSSPARKRQDAREPARADDLERLIGRLEEVARLSGYLWESNPDKSMRPFRQMAARAGLTRRETGIFMALMRQTLYKLEHPESIVREEGASGRPGE